MGSIPVWMAAMVRAHGAAPETSLASLPFSEAELRRRRIDWAVFAEFMEILEVDCGGREALTRGAEVRYPEFALRMMPLLGLVVTPRAFCRFVHRAVFPRAYGGAVRATDQDQDDGILQVRMEITEPNRGCLPFFHATEGALRGVPRLFGQGPAAVTSELTARFALYRVALPQQGSVRARLRRAMTRQSLDAVLEDVEASWSELGQHLERPGPDPFDRCLRRATRRWKLTNRQQGILAEVARGRSNKEAAANLGCALHTVELHVTDILRRTGHPSRSALIADFWFQA